ncbi:acylphosphatase, partial [Vibrio cholerae O1]|uniref:acylphosphatase n=1 Tax=Vibrio cholerae TaxID=666 RepID=UPI001C1247D3
PFVNRTAVDAGVAGYVRKTGDSAEATFEGSQAAIERVLQTVRTDPPPLETVEAVDVEWRDLTGIAGFEIRDSTGEH